MAAYTLAVDYGTSNTVALLRWPDGRVRPLLFDGSPLLSSAVFAEEAGLIVGRDAVHSARLEPARFEPHPKRCIDDLDVLLGAQAFPVVVLFAAALRRVADEARQVTGGAPTDVILTHPAEWGGARRAVLVAAAALVGWANATLVPEPVAAATYFARVLGQQMRVGDSVVVYDLGAGTFDASVVRRTASGYDAMSCRGLDDLGGVDFEQCILDHVGAIVRAAAPAEWQCLTSPQTLGDRREARLLRDDARVAKERLSRSATATLLVPLANQDVVVSRDEFDRLAMPLIQRTVEVTRATIRAARVPSQQIVGVFLVGGSTRMPLVGTELHRALQIAPTVLEQPELVVAEGALYVTEPSTASRPAPHDPHRDGGALTASSWESPLPASAPAAGWESTPVYAPSSVPPPAPVPTPQPRPTPVDRSTGGRGPNGDIVRIEPPPDALRRRRVSMRVVAGVLLLIGVVGSSVSAPALSGLSLLAAIVLFAWSFGMDRRVPWAEFSPDGIRRGAGSESVLVHWSDIKAVVAWRPGPGYSPTIVVLPADHVARKTMEPWKSLWHPPSGGIRLGTLRQLRTTKAAAHDAMLRTAPRDHAARR